MKRLLSIIGIFVGLTGSVIVRASEDDIPRSILRSYELKADSGLRVRVQYKTLTGQWHLAEKLMISIGTSPPFVRRPKWNNDGGIDGDLIPLIERVYPAGPNRWAVLGWSSWGEGLQRNYAWIIESTSAGIKLSHRFEYETDRSSAGFALDVSEQVFRIGIPRPKKEVHLPGHWQLTADDRRLGFSAIRNLKYSSKAFDTIHQFFLPPTGGNPRSRGWSEQFAWFELTKDGFAESN